MNQKNKKTNASVATSIGLALLATTCCAVPLLLVTLGLGGAVASMVSTLPWLVTLSKYKIYTFLFTALTLGYAWFQISRVTQCGMADRKKLDWQKKALGFSTILLFLSILVAYGFLPLMMWLEKFS